MRAIAKVQPQGKSAAYKTSVYYLGTEIIWDYTFLQATRIKPQSALKVVYIFKVFGAQD